MINQPYTSPETKVSEIRTYANLLVLSTNADNNQIPMDSGEEMF